MNASTYQVLAARTIRDAAELNVNPAHLSLLTSLLHISKEVGAAVERLKKGIFHGHKIDWEEFDCILASVQYAIDNTDLEEAVSGDCRYCPTATPHQLALLGALAGLVGEAGEITGTILDHVENGFDLTELPHEIGDTVWYLSAISTEEELDFGDLFVANIAKLLERYPLGFSQSSSLARVDVDGSALKELAMEFARRASDMFPEEAKVEFVRAWTKKVEALEVANEV